MKNTKVWIKLSSSKNCIDKILWEMWRTNSKKWAYKITFFYTENDSISSRNFYYKTKREIISHIVYDADVWGCEITEKELSVLNELDNW